MSTSYISYPTRGVPIYSTASALPTPPPRSGSLAEVADTNILYVSNGSAWVALASPGASPTAIDGLTGDVSASGPGVVPATVNSVGGQSAANVASATSQVLAGAFLQVNGGNSPTADISWASHALLNASKLQTFVAGAITKIQSISESVAGGSQARGISSELHANSPSQPIFSFVKSRGTTASPLTVNNNDGLGAMDWFSYDGTSSLLTGVINLSVSGTVSTGIIPTTLTFSNSDATGTVNSNLILNPDRSINMFGPLDVGSNFVHSVTDPVAPQDAATKNYVDTATASAITSLTGDVSATGPGAAAATVNLVGGQSAANVAKATSEVLGSLPSFNHLVYVAPAGNDSTGDGSYFNPYATVSHAMSTAPTNLTSATRWGIVVMPGQINDPNPILMKGFVFVIGQSAITTIVSRLNPSVAIDLDPSVYNGTSSANPQLGFCNMTILVGSAGISFNTTGTTPNGNIFPQLNNCATPNIVMIDPLNVILTAYWDCLITGSITLHGVAELDLNKCNVNGSVVMNDTGVTGATIILTATNSAFFNTMTVHNNGASNTAIVQLVASPQLGGQTFTAVNPASSIFYDNVSLALGNTAGTPYSNSGFTLSALQEAESLFYNPTTPGDWSPAPSEVHTALDQLAARVVAGSPSVTDPGAYPYTTLATDKIVQVDSSSLRTINLLPSASTVVGQVLYIKDHTGNAALDNITVVPNGAETIDGLASVLITQNYGVLRLYSDGSNYFSL